jgi:hypothetical protein
MSGLRWCPGRTEDPSAAVWAAWPPECRLGSPVRSLRQTASQRPRGSDRSETVDDAVSERSLPGRLRPGHAQRRDPRRPISPQGVSIVTPTTPRTVWQAAAAMTLIPSGFPHPIRPASSVRPGRERRNQASGRQEGRRAFLRRVLLPGGLPGDDRVVELGSPATTGDDVPGACPVWVSSRPRRVAAVPQGHARGRAQPGRP